MLGIRICRNVSAPYFSFALAKLNKMVCPSVCSCVIENYVKEIEFLASEVDFLASEVDFLDSEVDFLASEVDFLANWNFRFHISASNPLENIILRIFQNNSGLGAEVEVLSYRCTG